MLHADRADGVAPAAQQQPAGQKCHEPCMTAETDHATSNHDQNASTTQPFHGFLPGRTTHPIKLLFVDVVARTVVEFKVCIILCRSVP